MISQFILLIVLSIAYFILEIEFFNYKKLTNKKIKFLIKRLRMYEYNQNHIFDEIISLKGVDCFEKGENCK